jgi:hypothetical protein
MPRALLIAALLIASPLLAQTSGDLSVPATHLGSATVSATAPQTPVVSTPGAPAQTQPGTNDPVIRLGSATVSATVPETPAEAVPAATVNDRGSNDHVASASLLAASRFELVESPAASPASVRGDMADTSISLGEYARKLRAHGQTTEFRTATRRESKTTSHSTRHKNY